MSDPSLRPFQIMENEIRYYLHVYDSTLRIYSQKKYEYQTANFDACHICSLYVYIHINILTFLSIEYLNMKKEVYECVQL